MRVGLYVPHVEAVAGGGHTYTSEITAALGVMHESTRHHIVLVSDLPSPPAEWLGESFISIGRPMPMRVAGRVRRMASEIAPRLSAQSHVDSTLLDAGIDLIWCPRPGTPTHWLPYVTTVWDMQHRLQPVFPEVGRGAEWVVRERFYSRELGQASMVVVGTEAGRAEVESLFRVPSNRIRCLPHPTPSFAFSPHARPDEVLRRYGLEPGFLLYPAQFWAHKNHVLLLKAAQRLIANGDSCPDLVFVGSDQGNEVHVRRMAADLGLSDRVRVLGFVPREDLTALYQKALAMAYVSYFGPENLPPLEAFALGCPVIATDVTGSEEQLGDAAIRVSLTDPDVLAAAVTSLSNDGTLRDELVRRGRHRAEERAPGRYVGGMMAIIDELEPAIRTWR